MTFDSKDKEEEYHFPDSDDVVSDDQAGSYDVDQDEAGSVAEKITGDSAARNKKLILISVVIVFVLIIFAYMRSSQKKESVALHKKKPSYATVASVNSMLGQVSQNQENIANFNNSLSASSETMTELRSKQSDIAQNIASLQNQVQVLTTEIAQMQVKPSHKKKKVRTVIYHLKALVPGRAWLLGSNGVATSVAKGDKLDGYGVILSIDDNLGKVYTSSGASITYGPSDH